MSIYDQYIALQSGVRIPALETPKEVHDHYGEGGALENIVLDRRELRDRIQPHRLLLFPRKHPLLRGISGTRFTSFNKKAKFDWQHIGTWAYRGEIVLHCRNIISDEALMRHLREYIAWLDEQKIHTNLKSARDLIDQMLQYSDEDWSNMPRLYGEQKIYGFMSLQAAAMYDATCDLKRRAESVYHTAVAYRSRTAQLVRLMEMAQERGLEVPQ